MREFANKRNPVLPLEYHIPDGEGHVMPDGKLYLYGSYDDSDGVYCSEAYYVVSTPDMEHWTVHDRALDGNEIPWYRDPKAPKYPGIDWSNPTPFIRKILEEEKCREDGEEKAQEEKEDAACLLAPDCIEKDGKYYLYFCMQDDSEGVAVSDRPEGPFVNPVRFPCGGIDPAIFVDDDGQAYYYWGQLFAHGVKLNPDMVSFDRSGIVDNLVTEEEHFFHEGSSMRKIGDTYYYVYADMERGKPTSLGYATGTSPLGPFTYRGIIIDNDGCDPASWNNHGSIECVNGRWYVFYHRCSRGGRYYRRLCIEPITIHPDGSIDEVKMTSQGIGAPFGPGERIFGYQACGVSGEVYIGVNEGSREYPEKLMHIFPGDEAVFRYVRSEEAWKSVSLTCYGSGKAEILLNGRAVGTVCVEGAGPVSRGSALIHAPAGEYELTLRFLESDGLEVLEVGME